MSEFKIRRAAVLGAGVMGSKIAAHLANAGIASYLLDVAPSDLAPEEQGKGLSLDSPVVRNRIVQGAWKAALNSKPAPLFSPELAALVTTGNFTDNMDWVGKADWIIEAVTENLDVKRKLFHQVESHRKPGTVVSSNTSGIPIHSLAQGFSEDFRKHFLGTHFFNPPRYLKLLEIIPTPDTDPDLTRFLIRFGEDQLGKGVVLCKDTPNFIGNRIATQGICVLLKAMMDEGLTVEEVDLLTGPVLGRPKSATFRTFDVVGVDTFVLVIRNLHDLLPDPTEREIFTVPPFVQTMLQNRWLGDKTGQGFYKKIRSAGGTEIHYLDYQTMEYRPAQHPRFAALDRIKKLPSLEKQLRELVFGSDRAGKFLWKVLSSSLSYAASKVPEISDDIMSVDRAMKWGFLYKLGPFETWDALGVEAVKARLQEEGRPIPPLVESLLASGKKSFYKRRSGKTLYFDAATAAYVKEPERRGVIVLSSFKTRNRIVRQNPGASLLDIGDGVACLEFHSKMNSIDADIIQMTHQAVEEVSRNFEGLVIANEGENFSAGANLMEILGASRAGKWDAIDQVIRGFQQANARLRYSEKPVVAAPHQMALGGGCEIVIQSDQVHTAAELYIGFVEVGVGLVPAGGGCAEMVSRAAQEAGSDSDTDLFPRIRKVFELIGTARVSGSAAEASALGLLSERDHVSMNQEQRIYHAKQDVLTLVREGYRPPAPGNDIPVLGQPGLASLKLGLHLMERAGYITEYDKVVGTHLAVILTGGAFLGTRKVGRQHLLDLEREAFLALCGQPKTQERMEHMLRQGKPLRN